MNIEKYLPYWHQGRHYSNHFEMKPALHLEGWQHPDQHGTVSRPDGHEIIRILEARFLHRVIGLVTLIHYQQFPETRPAIFQNIHMCGWLDVIYGPYPEVLADSKKPPLFVPTLTPQNKIHWMDLNSGFNCLDYVPIRRLT